MAQPTHPSKGKGPWGVWEEGPESVDIRCKALGISPDKVDEYIDHTYVLHKGYRIPLVFGDPADPNFDWRLAQRRTFRHTLNRTCQNDTSLKYEGTLTTHGYQALARPPPVAVPDNDDLAQAKFFMACAATLNDSAFGCREKHPGNAHIKNLFSTGLDNCIITYPRAPSDVIRRICSRGNLFNGLGAGTSPQEVLAQIPILISASKADGNVEVEGEDQADDEDAMDVDEAEVCVGQAGDGCDKRAQLFDFSKQFFKGLFSSGAELRRARYVYNRLTTFGLWDEMKRYMDCHGVFSDVKVDPHKVA